MLNRNHRKEEFMITILEKLGTNKRIMEILSGAGWDGTYSRFAMQKLRGKLSLDVALILWEYCQKNHIPVARKDFYEATPY